MNEGAIFLVGIIIFAITIYGVVMAGGMALTRVVVEQDPHLQTDPHDTPLAPGTPRHVP